MDRICISGLPVKAVIGTYPEERHQPQQLFFDLTLTGDFSLAGKTDTLQNTVDYHAVEEKVIAMAESSSFFLLEALAERTAELCLTFSAVQSVAVRIAKPAAALRGETIALEIERSRA